MKSYRKPIVEIVDDTAEIVCADSSGVTVNDGNDVKVTCRFGRTEANAGADTCQSCYATNGTEANKKGTYRDPSFACIDNLPLKG
jgi:hypothetical protein